MLFFISIYYNVHRYVACGAELNRESEIECKTWDLQRPPEVEHRKSAKCFYIQTIHTQINWALLKCVLCHSYLKEANHLLNKISEWDNLISSQLKERELNELKRTKCQTINPNKNFCSGCVNITSALCIGLYIFFSPLWLPSAICL